MSLRFLVFFLWFHGQRVMQPFLGGGWETDHRAGRVHPEVQTKASRKILWNLQNKPT